MASKVAEGRYFDGKSSSSHPARLGREGESVAVEYAGDRRSFAVREIRASALGNRLRAVEFPDGGRFESEDAAAMDELFPARGLVAFLESRWRWAVLAAGGLVATLLFGYFVALPVLAERIAARVPGRWKVELSRQTVKLLETTYLKPSDLGPSERSFAEGAIRRVTREEPGLRIHLRKSDSLGANALALPDGTVFVTDDLVRLAKTEEELAAVLYHEAAHVRFNHGTADLVANSFLAAALFTVAGGDFTALPLLLLNSSYSRRYETAADDYAARILSAKGGSPRALARMLERMAKKEKEGEIPSLLSSHPATVERIRRLER